MTVQQLMRHYINELRRIYPEGEADSISRMAFEYFAGSTRSAIIRDPSVILPSDQEKKLLDALSELLQHKPIQYITGEAWFYGMKLHVSPAVLIPRPETEELVALAIRFVQTLHDPTVLDIGTGSGCIPIAIKKHVQNTDITSIDTSEDALNMARENARLQTASIHLRKCDFLNECEWNEFGSFDLIISNPPYIPASQEADMEANVTAYEPSIALFTPDENPCIFYEKMALFSEKHLNPAGKLMAEIHEQYGTETLRIFRDAGFEVELIKDMFGKDRMLVASRCPSQLQK